MYEIDEIVYANEPGATIEIESVTPIDDMMMLVTFTTKETRLFDASQLLSGDAFKSLENPAIFNAPVVDGGVCTWNNGKIDVAPEYMYEHSFEYELTA